MSLNKKLWLAIVYILILATGGSLIFSTLYSRLYLEEQLQTKNSDNANALALSMSQLEKDFPTLDLLISAQFDSGHYHYIGLFDPDGKVLTERLNARSQSKAPAWFIQLLPIKVKPGIAEVQDGWSQFGTLRLESNLHFAYDSLWESTRLIALWSIIIGLVSCYIGSQLLRKILRPLGHVMNQAAAIGEHRFITVEEPKTAEFKALVSAMNSLSNRIKNSVSEESARLEALQHQANFCPISGLMNRDYFMRNIDASISHEEQFDRGVLLVFRLANLALIDHTLGHMETNAFLKSIGNALENACKRQPSLIAGRISGADFGVFSNTPEDVYLLGDRFKNTLNQVCHIAHATLDCHLLAVATLVSKNDTSTQLVALTDKVLEDISSGQENVLHVIHTDDVVQHHNANLTEWQRLLSAALDAKRLKLGQFPVISPKGALIHHESPVRLQLVENEKWFSAGEFMAWATQLQLMRRVDELVIEKAIELLSNTAEPIGINVSAEAICDKNFIKKAVKLIQSRPKLAPYLCFEVPEQGVFNHLEAFKYFCATLKALGCKIGIEHVGSRISRLGELHDAGLDYMKIDASVIRDINQNEANKTLLKGLCIIAHSVGALAIAEGVQTADEIAALTLIGIDGMTGPGIQLG